MTIFRYLRSDSVRSYVISAVALTCLWALIERLGLGIAYRYPLTQIIVMRYAMQLLLLAAVCLPTDPGRLVRTTRLGAQLGRGACMFLMPMSFLVAGSSLSGSQLWATFWVAPLVVIALAWWWLGERVSPMTWIIAGVGYVGALLVMGDAPVVAKASIWPLISALSFAIYVVMSRRLSDENIEASLFYTSVVALVCMLPFALPFWRSLHLDDLWRFATIGVVGLILLALIDRSVEKMPASFAAPFLFGAVIWEAVIAFLRDGYSFPRAAVLGGALLLVVAAVLIRRPRALGYES